MPKNFKDQARGMMIGLAVGDALGAPVQFDADSVSIRANLATLRDLHDNHVLPKGVWTDDTSMALCIADSLLECGGYDSYDLMEKFCSWENLGYRSYFNCGYDVGLQVDRAICAYAVDPIVPKNQERVWNAGNGNIMRLAPTIIAGHQDLAHAVELAWLSGRETHYSEVAECGTEVFANLLFRALELSDKSAIVRLDNLYFTSDELHECWLDNSWYVEGRIHSDGKCLRDLGGYVMDALTIAIWGFLRAKDFESGMLEVLQLGGDTDTNCAIYGQLAGAYYGFENIPKRWVENLYLADEIIALADRLATMPSCPILATRFEEDEEYFAPPESSPATQSNSRKPNIYLDIDGVLTGTASRQSDIVEFINFLLENYPDNLYWLTTHCRRGENNTLWVLKQIFDPDLAERIFNTVQPTNWSLSKTEGIDFFHSFIWFDDNLFEFERKVLEQHHALDSLFQMDPKDPKMAQKALEYLKKYKWKGIKWNT